MNIDLHQFLASARPSQRQLDAMVASGIPGPTQAKAGGIGAATVRFLKDGSFDFDGISTVKAMILPAFD